MSVEGRRAAQEEKLERLIEILRDPHLFDGGHLRRVAEKILATVSPEERLMPTCAGCADDMPVRERGGKLYHIYEGDSAYGRLCTAELTEACDESHRELRAEREELKAALQVYWLSSIECNHYESNDSAICACGWKSDRGFNVGKAVEFWIDHVFERARASKVLGEKS